MKALKGKKGFTLIEVIVILAVIAILAAVLSPMIIGYIRDASVRRAESDVKTIAAAVQAFNKDMKDWPIWQNGTARQANSEKLAVLETADGDTPYVSDVGGPIPTGAQLDTIDNHLVKNTPGGSAGKAYPTEQRDVRKWAGPYLDKVSRDPWGNKYYVDVTGLQPQEISGFMPVYVVSAGPNKILETAFAQEGGPSIDIKGDDIVFRIK